MGEKRVSSAVTTGHLHICGTRGSHAEARTVVGARATFGYGRGRRQVSIKSEEKRFLKKETWEILIYERRTDDKGPKEELRKVPEQKGRQSGKCCGRPQAHATEEECGQWTVPLLARN